LPKIHPKKESNLPTQERCSRKDSRITGLNVTGKKGLLQLPKRVAAYSTSVLAMQNPLNFRHSSA
jgi:hypothetical protein